MDVSSAGIVECPLCGVPHRTAAVTCDGCGQPLHVRPDLAGMKAEYRRRRYHMAGSLAVIVGMLVVNWALFGGGAYVIALAPIGWFGWSWTRARTLKRALERRVVAS